MISRRDILKAATGALSLTGLSIPLEKTLSQQLKEIGPIPEPLVRNVDNGFLGLQGCRLFDAEGNEFEHVVECVLETGRIVRHKLFKHPTDGKNYICYDEIDGKETPIITEEIYAPAPLWTLPLDTPWGWHGLPNRPEAVGCWKGVCVSPYKPTEMNVCPMWEICNCHYPNRPVHAWCPTHDKGKPRCTCTYNMQNSRCPQHGAEVLKSGAELLKEVWEELND